VSVVYLVLPLAVTVAAIAAFVFVRAARSGQFDDLDTPGVRMLHDDEDDPGGER
jgi:cbb3-type cytochrome oxidase maturation protein